jgi:hypothetical protein
VDEISSNRTGATIGIGIRAAQGLLRFGGHGEGLGSSSADSDAGRIDGGDSILNGGGCAAASRRDSTEREASSTQYQGQQARHWQCEQCTTSKCQQSRSNTNLAHHPTTRQRKHARAA